MELHRQRRRSGVGRAVFRGYALVDLCAWRGCRACGHGSAGGGRLPLLATSSAGDALLVWGHGHAIAIDRMAPGGRLRPPVVAGHFPVADVAIDGHGNATLLGYTAGGGRFFVSTAPRNGSFGKPTTLPFTSSIAHVSSGTAGQTIV